MMYIDLCFLNDGCFDEACVPVGMVISNVVLATSPTDFDSRQEFLRLYILLCSLYIRN